MSHVAGRRLAVLVAFCIALGLAPSAAQAADLALTTRSAPARPDQLVKLRAMAPAASTCVLRVDAQRLRITTPSTQRFVISGRVSRRARPGSHSLSLSCSAQRAPRDPPADDEPLRAGRRDAQALSIDT